MSKQPSNAHFYFFSHSFFFLRYQFWPLLVPSIAVFFLIFCPQWSHASQISSNADRTVAKLGPRELQHTLTATPSIFPAASPYSHSSVDDANHALYVVTLDGKITAIDADGNGRQLWTADTGLPLVDSSLSKIEITRDSRSVRLIPSLIGGLYEKYDEDGHIEALPFDAESLLDASFKLHDDSVITGGKHIDTLGLDSHSGQILYSFSNDHFKTSPNTVDNNQSSNDSNQLRSTLVVKRTTQTIRARSARNGYEKWNFSVSNHELLYLRAQSANIVVEPVNHQKTDPTKYCDHFEYQLQTGVVAAFDQNDRKIWSSAINAPIAAVWELKNGQLTEKSLFEPINTHQSDDDDDGDPAFSPPPMTRRLAFIGEFNSTPYVLVPPRIQKQLIHDARKIAGSPGHRRPFLLSWQKAYQKRTLSVDSDTAESRDSRTIGMNPAEHHYPLALRPDPQKSSSTLHIENQCDTGGYLELINDFVNEDEQPKDHAKRTNITLTSNTVTVSTVFFGALIAIAIYCMYYYKSKGTLLSRLQSTMTETSVAITTTTVVTPTPTPPSTPDYLQIETPFQSRYTLEYEHVRFLGRGGFGVVFEAINKLDERRVAIKRVSLKKPSGKERALKEIRYLAVLNHPHLIQYYYAWNESPPVGWQEEQDKTLLLRTDLNARDSISSFPTSANDSESIHQRKIVHSLKSPLNAPPSLIDFTFDRDDNPLRIHEDFTGDPQKSDDDSVSNSFDSNNNKHLLRRHRSSATTKSSMSSSSPLFDYSTEEEDEEDEDIDDSHHSHQEQVNREVTDSDDGIIFLPGEKSSTTSLSISQQQQQQSQTKSLLEIRKSTSNEKDSPPTYFYFVMELCKPESLRDRLVQRTIDRSQGWSIFDQIVRGIEYIHSKKLIHRDLKPSNILFSLDDTVKIGDFGLVSAFGEDKSAKKKKRDDDKLDKFQPIDTVSFTSDAGGNNEIGGTILYMSPEQINREQYNQKVDIYAMGIILFELLYPFSTQMERMHSIANLRLPTPVFPKDFEHDVTNRNKLICQLIRRLLSYSPRDRPRASDLLQDLNTVYQHALRLEAPHLTASDPRQSHLTMVNGQDQTPTCSPSIVQQRCRTPSSSFRRTVSSSILHSFCDSESVELDS